MAGVAATLDAPPESLFARLTALGIREADLVPRHDGTLLGDLPPTLAEHQPDTTTAPRTRSATPCWRPHRRRPTARR